MFWENLAPYRILISGLLAWWLAQVLKPLFYYWTSRRWNWGMWISAGGMPSSHSSLVVSTAVAIGLFSGFETPAFAVSLAVAMIVVYDAAGVRRQAGIHAQRINMMLNELFSGHPISQDALKEVLGHTPRQVIAGIFLGILVPVLIYFLWP